MVLTISKNKLLFLAFSLLVACLAITSPTLAQEEQQQEGPSYTQEEYNAYQAAVEEGPSGIVNFLNENPDSELSQYAIGAYLKIIQDRQSAGNHAEAVEAGEQFLSNIDSDRFDVQFLTAWSSFHSQQYDKAVKYSEQAYDAAPDQAKQQLDMILMRSNLQLGNQDAAMPYAEKICNNGEPSQCYDIYPMLMRKYAEAKQWSTAAQWAQKNVEALDTISQPEGVSASEWDEYVTEERSASHAIMGRSAAESDRWSTARQHYQTVLQITPRSKGARHAEGYYYIGRALWADKQIDAAMEAFAKGSVIQGAPHAGPCRKNLETLYRSTHNDSLAGLDEFINRVTSS